MGKFGRAVGGRKRKPHSRKWQARLNERLRAAASAVFFVSVIGLDVVAVWNAFRQQHNTTKGQRAVEQLELASKDASEHSQQADDDFCLAKQLQLVSSWMPVSYNSALLDRRQLSHT